MRRVAELEAAIGPSVEDANARAVLAEDIAELKAALNEKNPDPEAVTRPMQALTGKLKVLGVTIRKVAELVEPTKAIAGLLQIPLKLFGL